MSEVAEDSKANVGIAFGLVIGAGFSTAIGAAVVFIPSLVRFANRKTLAGSLGLSAGVMLYVSFVEIFVKSRDAFLAAGHGSGGSIMYSTICFFSGVLLMVILNGIVSALTGGHHHPGPPESDKEQHHQDPSCSSAPSLSESPMGVPACPCHSPDPIADLQNLQNMANEIEEFEHSHGADGDHWHGHAEGGDDMEKNRLEEGTIGSFSSEEDEGEGLYGGENRRKLILTSVNTALAIALHNFPEGLATFVATLDDPGVGGVLAVAIAIHNIPEGLCVAMPIYYATGSRWKAFGWALLSGVSEPVAALLGWAVLANHFTDTLYGILFGLVAGMMVIISIKELLPTAHRYDPEDSVVNVTFIIGMFIMALSLVLFAA